MDQHMQQLDARGVTEQHQVINHMMGYTPELHQIWTGTVGQKTGHWRYPSQRSRLPIRLCGVHTTVERGESDGVSG